MLTGELVILRPIEPEDYPALAGFANDIEVSQLVGGRPPVPMPLATVAELLEKRRTNPDEVNFAITDQDGALIGQCGLFRHEGAGRTAELGIAIGDRDYWDRGYGREAVSLLTEYALRVRNIRKVHLSVNATNERAIRAYTAAGFSEEGRRLRHAWCDGAYVDVVLMGRFQL